MQDVLVSTICPQDINYNHHVQKSVPGAQFLEIIWEEEKGAGVVAEISPMIRKENSPNFLFQCLQSVGQKNKTEGGNNGETIPHSVPGPKTFLSLRLHLFWNTGRKQQRLDVLEYFEDYMIFMAGKRSLS